jgi:hypothetical protein
VGNSWPEAVTFLSGFFQRVDSQRFGAARGPAAAPEDFFANETVSIKNKSSKSSIFF